MKDNVSWTFFTNHAHVLICLNNEPTARLRDIAEKVMITERAVQRIVSELEEAGYLIRIKEGRCNRYKIKNNISLRHPVEGHKKISDLFEFVNF